ncbi:MAG: hypothetical protein AAB225_26130 [Acidobacteriota bacterium]
MRDTGYSLSEAAVLSNPWVSTATLPDVLARPAVLTAPGEALSTATRRVVIRNGPMPPSLLKSVQGVVELLALPAGWNSYSAKPIAPDNAIRAIRLLAELLEPQTPPPAVVPTVRGGIQLEWHTNGINIEIYIDSPEDVRFFAEDIESGEVAEEPLAGHENTLRLWVQRVSGK